MLLNLRGFTCNLLWIYFSISCLRLLVLWNISLKKLERLIPQISQRTTNWGRSTFLKYLKFWVLISRGVTGLLASEFDHKSHLFRRNEICSIKFYFLARWKEGQSLLLSKTWMMQQVLHSIIILGCETCLIGCPCFHLVTNFR